MTRIRMAPKCRLNIMTVGIVQKLDIFLCPVALPVPSCRRRGEREGIRRVMGTARRGVLWRVAAWYDVVAWRGVAWHGAVPYGVARLFQKYWLESR